MSLSLLFDPAALQQTLAPLGKEMAANALAQLEAFVAGQAANIVRMTSDVAKALLALAVDYEEVAALPDKPTPEMIALREEAAMRREAQAQTILQANAAVAEEIQAFWAAAKKIALAVVGAGVGGLGKLLLA